MTDPVVYIDPEMSAEHLPNVMGNIRVIVPFAAGGTEEEQSNAVALMGNIWAVHEAATTEPAPGRRE